MATGETEASWGDTEARRRDILAAAAVLLDEGGYGALAMRPLAERAGMSAGLIYQYFIDKEDVCAALLQRHQITLTELMDSVPRVGGVRTVLRAIVPEIVLQWGRVGRLAATHRHRARARDLSATTAAQFAALRRMLEEAASAEKSRLRDSPALVPFVWAGLMGLADDLVNGWSVQIDRETLIDYAVDALARGITEPDTRRPARVRAQPSEQPASTHGRRSRQHD